MAGESLYGDPDRYYLKLSKQSMDCLGDLSVGYARAVEPAKQIC